MTQRSYSYADIKAKCNDLPDGINPRQPVRFEYASTDGIPMTTKLKLEPGYVRCPMCGEAVQRLYATRRGLVCEACKKRNARNVWGEK